MTTEDTIIPRLNRKMRAWYRKNAVEGQPTKRPTRLILGRAEALQLKEATQTPVTATQPQSEGESFREQVFKDAKPVMFGLYVTKSKREHYLRIL